MTPDPMVDAAEMLWVVLANVSGGDWTKQTPEWQEAAARWRDNYFAALKAAPHMEPPRVSYLDGYTAALKDAAGSDVLQAVLDAISGTLDPHTQIADHPNVKFAQMERLKLLKAGQENRP
jgi:hypothetical protein